MALSQTGWHVCKHLDFYFGKMTYYQRGRIQQRTRNSCVPENAGAKRAKDLIDDPGQIRNPFLNDLELLEAAHTFEMREPSHSPWDKKRTLRQPFFGMLVRNDEIAWEEHKDASYSDCHCCKIFSTIPHKLRNLPFTAKLYQEYLELRPSIDEVKDLVSERKCEFCMLLVIPRNPRLTSQTFPHRLIVLGAHLHRQNPPS